MQFDHAHKPHRDGLTPDIADLMDRAFYRNRANGFNVQYITDLGTLDEYSFNSRERAEAFAANLARHGHESAFSK